MRDLYTDIKLLPSMRQLRDVSRKGARGTPAKKPFHMLAPQTRKRIENQEAMKKLTAQGNLPEGATGG